MTCPDTEDPPHFQGREVLSEALHSLQVRHITYAMTIIWPELPEILVDRRKRQINVTTKTALQYSWKTGLRWQIVKARFQPFFQVPYNNVREKS